MTSDKIGTAIVSFLVGALFGAAIALIFAPMSGRELQYRIRKEADLDMAKARAEYHRNLAGLQRRVDSLKSRVPSMS